MEKYSKDGDFTDPVVRCEACQKLVFMEDIRKLGRCTCGNRKVRNVFSFTPEERKKLEARNVDPDFLALFEEVPGE